MSEIFLFTSKQCVHCPAEKKYLEEKNVKFIEVDVHSEIFEYLQSDLLRNGIILKMVPTIIKRDGNKMIIVNRDVI